MIIFSIVSAAAQNPQVTAEETPERKYGDDIHS